METTARLVVVVSRWSRVTSTVLVISVLIEANNSGSGRDVVVFDPRLLNGANPVFRRSTFVVSIIIGPWPIRNDCEVGQPKRDSAPCLERT